MASKQTQLSTVGAIARQLQIPQHRVSYAVSILNLTEAQRVGILRLFDGEAVEKIRLFVTSDRRAGRTIRL